MRKRIRQTSHKATKEVAIVVPLSNRKELTAEEDISLSHLVHYLGHYDKYLVAPKSLDIDIDGFGVRRFCDSYFGSVMAHSKLMLSAKFYEAFREYRYILTYHLDALVFSDQLMEWCEKGFDFIGAPRLANFGHPCVVGNGGFALRKVESFLRVFYSDEYAIDPEEYWKFFCAGRSWPSRCLNLPRKYLKRLKYFNNISREIELCMKANAHFEDIFISEKAARYYPDFKIAPLEMALRFAFDEEPKTCFELNGFNLPFGCHAWHKHDMRFWEPYLLKEEAAQQAGIGDWPAQDPVEKTRNVR